MRLMQPLYFLKSRRFPRCNLTIATQYFSFVGKARGCSGAWRYLVKISGVLFLQCVIIGGAGLKNG